MKGFTYIIFAILISSFAGCINSFGPEEIKNLRSPLQFGLKELSTRQMLTNINGIYVSGQYAYIISSEGFLYVLDVGNPYSTLYINTVFLNQSAESIFGTEKYLFIANGAAGLRIMDISNPLLPKEVGYCDTIGYANDVYVYSNCAYVISNNALWIIRIDKPNAPEVVAKYTIDTGSPKGIYISNYYAYIADYDGGLLIIDVLFPHHIREVAHYDANGYVEDVFYSDHYAYILVDGYGLDIVSTSNLANLSSSGRCKGFSHGQYITVKDTIAYVMDYQTGLYVIDVSSIYHPKKISVYKTHHGECMYIYNNYAYLGVDNNFIILDLFIPADE